ncbi:hypothetical protein E4U57_007672 [Claviceps arundinis]|uniref:Uncharacterized protein n=1 Tax=Claviceps arundinis TaxID=1623583 RepID=A0ABQ7P0Y7_9HYPO|nr:hypothetical protein E4U57_007672 [Claviceps arundinis]
MSILESGDVLKTTDFDVHWFINRQHFINPPELRAYNYVSQQSVERCSSQRRVDRTRRRLVYLAQRVAAPEAN